MTSDAEHSRDFPVPGRAGKSVLTASNAAAWTAFPAAVIVYLADLSGSLGWDYRAFDEVEVWLLALAAVGLKVASLRPDEDQVDAAWYDGLRLGVARAGHSTKVANRRRRFFARPAVWTVMGYIACAAWTAAAMLTFLVMRRVVQPDHDELLLGMMLLLLLAVQGTTIRVIGPGLTRVRAAYDNACAAQQSLREHKEIYQCLQELEALNVIDMVRVEHVLEVIAALNALMEQRKSSEGKPRLALVE